MRLGRGSHLQRITCQRQKLDLLWVWRCHVAVMRASSGSIMTKIMSYSDQLNLGIKCRDNLESGAVRNTHLIYVAFLPKMFNLSL